jgi:NADPH-dependent 7-cyano-7-deazaguanine reductase QueF-like protein
MTEKNKPFPLMTEKDLSDKVLRYDTKYLQLIGARVVFALAKTLERNDLLKLKALEKGYSGSHAWEAYMVAGGSLDQFTIGEHDGSEE